VRLRDGLRERAVLMERDPRRHDAGRGAALSVLVLADLHDAAEHAGVQWTLLLDEFGASSVWLRSAVSRSLNAGASYGGT